MSETLLPPTDKKSNLLKDVNPSIFAQLHPTKNINTNLDMVTYGSNKTLWWICSICGAEYQKSPKARKQGAAHNECNKKLAAQRRCLTTDEFIERARAKHGNERYDYSKVVYVNTHIDVTIICTKCKLKFPHNPEKYEFQQNPGNHIQGNGCQPCARELVGLKNRNTLEEFVEKAQAVHGKILYDYSLVVYVTNTTPIVIGCNRCKQWFVQTPSDHSNGGHGCQPCAWAKRGFESRKTLAEFIEEAAVLHEGLYGYTKVEYKTNKDRILIDCKTCGNEFPSTPNNHLKGAGCRKCAIVLRGLKKRRTIEEFIEEAHVLYGTDRYDYTKSIYTKYNEKLTIICKTCNLDFEQKPVSHLNGHDGCMKCRRGRRESKGAANCRKYLESRGITIVFEHRFPLLPTRRYDFMFYYNSHWYVVEFDGAQHFTYTPHWHIDFEDFLFKQEIDKLKTTVALVHGCTVLRISNDKYETIVAALDYFLSLPTDTVYLGVDASKYDYMLQPLDTKCLVTRVPEYRTLVKAVQAVDLSDYARLYNGPQKFPILHAIPEALPDVLPL